MPNAIPHKYHSITPYITVTDAAAAIEFYKQAFGAVELYRMDMPDGKIGHAEIQIGDSVVMLSDEWPAYGALSPTTLGGSPVGLAMYVEDVDAAFDRAIAAGAQEERAVQDQFYGDRTGTLIDPYGHKWTIATHIENVAPEEMIRRMNSAS
jgi:PhnB protein